MANKKRKLTSKEKGSLYIGRDVNLENGDFVVGDKKISVGDRAAYAGGNIENSTLITGNNNDLSTLKVRNELFEEIFNKIAKRADTSAEDKEDLQANVDDIKAEAAKGELADETFLARRLRYIKRMAPDILDVVVATLTNPAAGFALVVKKLADRIKTGVGDDEVKA